MKTPRFATKLGRKARLAWLDRISDLTGCELEMWESFCESAGPAAFVEFSTTATQTGRARSTPRK